MLLPAHQPAFSVVVPSCYGHSPGVWGTGTPVQGASPPRCLPLLSLGLAGRPRPSPHSPQGPGAGMRQHLPCPHRFCLYGCPDWPRCLLGWPHATFDGPSLPGASSSSLLTSAAPLAVRGCCHFVTARVRGPRASLTGAKPERPYAPPRLVRCVLGAGGAVAVLMVPHKGSRRGIP
ncbi:hypothetical protein NDU88_005984 [Pleurodeles waltl]|uniref:Uncharacterized protein n=1 Tax=Pleurodeles waltl TaxID=8319 RepID=A0AAV7TDH7_PLEWA|nr:hypothetical protein NDU88_005984 [Pleurodeles waltl]